MSNDELQKLHQTRKLAKARIESLKQEIKEIETEILSDVESRMVMLLDVMGIDGVRFPDGTLSKKTTTHMKIDNAEVMCRYMLEEMKKADAEGRPLGDCLLLQKTPNRGVILDIIHRNLGEDATNEQVEAEAAKYGAGVFRKVGVTFYKK